MDRETIKRSARAAFWCAATGSFVLAVMPGDPHVFDYDKYNHMLAFATLAVLGRLGWTRGRAWLIGAALVAFGGLIELCQALPEVHRDASWADLAADAIAVAGGLALGTALLALIRQRAPGDRLGG